MAIDYKKELERASKNMILLHKPDVLIKMILHTIVQKIPVAHASILLYDKEKDTYVLTASKGAVGARIPEGFARIDPDNSLIRFFKEGFSKQFFTNTVIVYSELKEILINNLDSYPGRLLHSILNQMEIYEAAICIPAYFRDDLLGILFLGAKKTQEPFEKDELDFFVALTRDVAMAIRNAQLFNELALELERKHRLFIHTTIAFAAAIDAKDHYTHGHTTRVTNFCLEIAGKLSRGNKKMFNEKFLEQLHIAALLHDIGKIGIPEFILNKEGPLNDEERKRIQEHPFIGATILNPIQELRDAVLGVKYHHERFDGTGYPEGLKGDNIPLIAAVIAVADAFDAMTTDRPYRKGLSKKSAIEEIKRVSGKQLNPQIAEIAVALHEEGKI